MRKSFLLHIDSLCILEDLTDEQKGQLFNAIYMFQLGEEIILSPMIKIAFSQFKNQFMRDEEKYKNTCQARKLAGSKGGKQRVANQANATNCKQDEANQAENKNKNKSDNDNNKDSVNDIIIFLNKKANTSYRSSGIKTISLINARLNEGFTIKDFETVINKKCDTWLSDKKMSAYLRPETLFGTKFEGYLNEVVAKNSLSLKDIVYDENEAF